MIETQAVAGRAHHLPVAPDALVGHDREVADVAALLTAARLVTLVGPPGAATTRLAGAVAARAAQHYPDGAWYVDLAHADDAHAVHGAVRAALGRADEPGRPAPARLAWLLRDRCALLVLDHRGPAHDAVAGLAAALARGCPQLTVLAAGPQALGLPDEQPHQVAPPPPPDAAAAPQPAPARDPAWCVALAEEAAPELAAGDQARWLARLDAEYGQLRAALADAHHDPVTLTRLAGALTLYWSMRGRFHEGRRWLEAAVDSDAGSPRQRATARWGAALIARALGNHPRATAHARAAQHLAADSGDTALHARALAVLGVVGVTTEEDLPAATAQLAEATAAARETGDVWCEISAVVSLGLGNLLAGEPEAARSRFEACLAVAGPPGTAAGPAHRLHPLVGLARVELTAGDHQTAERHLRDALVLARRLGIPAAAANALRYLARATRLRRPDPGGDLIAPADADVEDLAALGRLAAAKGDAGQARRLLDEALALARADGTPAQAARLQVDLAALARRTGDRPAARDRLDAAQAAARACADAPATAGALHERGHLARADGDHAGAVAHHHAALVAWGDAAGVAGGLEALGGLAVVQGDPRASARLYGAAAVVRAAADVARRPVDQAGYVADVAVLRQALGPHEVDAAWERGAARSLDATVAGAAPPATPRPPGSGPT